MKTFFIFIICFLAYLVILLSVPVQIFPEFFFYPWLVAKGLVQYKSFFDHHGFLTSILLSPFSKNITVLSLIFVGAQLDQFAIVAYLIHRKVKRPLMYLLLLVVYISFQFAIVQQQLWFDAGMAFFLVIAWFFLERKKEDIAWFFLACTTMIKPTALLFTIPFFIKSKNKKSNIIFFVSWFLALFYFISRGAVGQLWNQLILFNYSYIQSTYKIFYIGIQSKLLLAICIGFSLLLFYLYKKKYKNISLLFMTLISFSFFFQGLSKLNFALFVPFCILLIADVFGNKKIHKIVGVLFLAFVLIMTRDAYKTYKDNQKRQVYLSPSVIQEAKQVGKLISDKKDRTILVIGNRVELYYLLDVLPSEFTPLHFPWVDKVYGREPDLKDIKYIIVPKKFGEYESISPQVKNVLNNGFNQIGQTASYTIWRYNRGITQ